MQPNNCPNCNGPAHIYTGPFKDHPVYHHPIYTRERTSQGMDDLSIQNTVYCSVCLIFTYEFSDLEEAIESWNTPHSLQIMQADGTDDWGPNPPMLIRVGGSDKIG